jgi:hypothetical protein
MTLGCNLDRYLSRSLDDDAVALKFAVGLFGDLVCTTGAGIGQMRVKPDAGSMVSRSVPELGDSQRLSNATLIAPDAA